MSIEYKVDYICICYQNQVVTHWELIPQNNRIYTSLPWEMYSGSGYHVNKTIQDRTLSVNIYSILIIIKKQTLNYVLNPFLEMATDTACVKKSSLRASLDIFS
uniref:Uncharacterized protein n=1 Tax=Cacopsylla melanoneura TaxID=428564 RepID=A0A8D8LYB5_9HEMI